MKLDRFLTKNNVAIQRTFVICQHTQCRSLKTCQKLTSNFYVKNHLNPNEFLKNTLFSRIFSLFWPFDNYVGKIRGKGSKK